MVERAYKVYEQAGTDAFISAIHTDILKRKVRYPILEFSAASIVAYFPDDVQPELADRLMALGENGSEVMAGKILQHRLRNHHEESIRKASEYIAAGGNWLCCDTIGERVFGYALLTLPDVTAPVLRRFSVSQDKWIVRAVGVAVHYAVKKGLKKQYVDEMFRLLLSMASNTELHVKKGVGWAAKTIAKFHPDIVGAYDAELADERMVKQWFITKIKIGLGRTYKYAGRYRS